MRHENNEQPKFLPYGRQSVDERDIEAVIEVLKSDWLTQGPTIERFEDAFRAVTGSDFAIACSSGTAALHLMMLALGLEPGDKIVTSPITFMATANAARYVGADVLFADVDPETGLIKPSALAELLEPDRGKQIKAVVPVHFAGQPCDLNGIRKLTEQHGAHLLDYACHAVGASLDFGGERYTVGDGRLTAMSAFSFHPVKHIAMGEGGAVTTNDPKVAERMRKLRNHGIERDHFANSLMAFDSDGAANPWYHELQELGYNYRLSDIHATLGWSQLKKLKANLEKRRALASYYQKQIAERFAPNDVRPLSVRSGIEHAWHLFVVLIDFERIGAERAVVMNRLRQAGVGTQVHYIPVHLQPYYRRLAGGKAFHLPGAMRYYEQALTIPLYPEMTETDCDRVIDELAAVTKRVVVR